MPELAEVEYFRKQWDVGMGKRVTTLATHPKARIFRGVDVKAFETALTNAVLQSSMASGKQMIFRFSQASIGIHLGMTGELRVETADYEPKKHDHLVIFQRARALVFSDPRLFGRVLFHEGKDLPTWWTDRAPDVLSAKFSLEALRAFLARRKAEPIKAVLLMQDRFPGVGNWMADEVLWQARIGPATKAGTLTNARSKALWEKCRSVCLDALDIIGTDWSDPPDSWLFNHRWQKGGVCPRCGVELKRADVGGRTTCWCPKCQK